MLSCWNIMDNAKGINSLMKDSKYIEPYCLHSLELNGCHRWVNNESLKLGDTLALKEMKNLI